MTKPLEGRIAVVAGATRGAGSGIAVRTDHSRAEEVRALFERVRQESGRLDILVNDIGGEDQPKHQRLVMQLAQLLP